MPARVKTLAAEWASLERAIFDRNTPKLQREEMRKAFYAGARSFYLLLMEGLDPGDDVTDADLGRLEALSRELDEFGEALQRVRGQRRHA